MSLAIDRNTMEDFRVNRIRIYDENQKGDIVIDLTDKFLLIPDDLTEHERIKSIPVKYRKIVNEVLEEMTEAEKASKDAQIAANELQKQEDSKDISKSLTELEQKAFLTILDLCNGLINGTITNEISKEQFITYVKNKIL